MIRPLLPLVIIGVVVWIVHTQRQRAATSGHAVPSLRRALQDTGLLAALAAASACGCAVCTGWTRPGPTTTRSASSRRSWTHDSVLVTVDGDGEIHVIPYEPA